jgi:hypothetical protein
MEDIVGCFVFGIVVMVVMLTAAWKDQVCKVKYVE